MEKFVKGEVVVVPFSFAVLLNKNHPALVLINSPQDVIVCFTNALLY